MKKKKKKKDPAHRNYPEARAALPSSKGEINESLHIIRTKSTFFSGIKCLEMQQVKAGVMYSLSAKDC